MENNQKSSKMNKIINAILMFVIVLLSFAGGFFIGGQCGGENGSALNQVISIINNTSYIIDPVTGQPRKITEKDYIDAITDGLLDEYSKYYTPEEYEEYANESEGNYGGIGFVTYSNTTKIFKILGNSPAEKAGIKAGETIIGAKTAQGQRVDFNSAEQLDDFFKQNSTKQEFVLYFDDGHEVKVTGSDFKVSYVTYYDNENKLCYRDGENGKLQPFIEASTQMDALPDDTGYIKLDLFEGDAATQFATALKQMLDSNRSKLILDLRDNGGGDVNVLTDIASYLIYNNGAKNSLIIHAERKNREDSYSTRANNFDQRLEKIVVLANRNTASASECLIGAMLTYGDRFNSDRSDLVIEKNASGVAKTFGKGIMQTTYVLFNGGAYKLTTGRVLWPDKITCIHGTGIIVDGQNAVNSADAINRAIQIVNT